MSAEQDALYAEAQRLFDQGDRAGAQRIAQQLQADGYQPQRDSGALRGRSAAPTLERREDTGGMPIYMRGTLMDPDRRRREGLPAVGAEGERPQRDPAQYPELMRGNEAAMDAFDEARRFQAAGDQQQFRLARARAVAEVNAARLLARRSRPDSFMGQMLDRSGLGFLNEGRAEAALLSYVPEGVSNFFGRGGRPQGMSEEEFNEYSRVLHARMRGERPVSSGAGVVLQALSIPGLGAENLAARTASNLGARGVTRAAAQTGGRLAENAVVGGALQTLNEDDADAFGEGALYGAVGGELFRALGNAVRHYLPGRPNAAHRTIARALADNDIRPQELDDIARRFRDATGREPALVDILSDPALGERGRIASNALRDVLRRTPEATGRLQQAEAEAVRASRARSAGEQPPNPRSSELMDQAMNPIRDTPIDPMEAARLVDQSPGALGEDLAQVIRATPGDEGMLASQIRRLQGADDVARADRAYQQAQAAMRAGETTQAVVDAAENNLRRALANYAENPVTLNEIDAIRQRILYRAQGTGGAHGFGPLREQVTAMGDAATGGAYGQALREFGENAPRERELLDRARESMGVVSPAGSSFPDGGNVLAHTAAAGGHAARGTVQGAAYHGAEAARGASRNIPAGQINQLSREITEQGGVNRFAENLERGRRQVSGETPDIIGAAGARAAAAQASPDDELRGRAPDDDALYQQAQELFDAGDREGAQRIVDELQRRNYQPMNTAEPTSFSGATFNDVEQMIADREAFRGEIYLDAGGHPTIGYGHLIRPGEDFSQGITEREARELMRRDIEENTYPLRDLQRQLTPRQREALISFGFNAGPGALQRVVDRINQDDGSFEGAIRIIQRYTTSRGRRVRGLVARRAMEVAALREEA